jgi:hypothetical protein
MAQSMTTFSAVSQLAPEGGEMQNLLAQRFSTVAMSF